MIYTSGSTGKPKGVVHTHGGWLAGIAHTMRMVFDAQDDDRLYVVGDPGWITGQSYLVAAPLVRGITTVIVEGSPLFPHAGRFASAIERHGVTLFKAGSTFLKAVMTDPASIEDMAVYDMSGVKVATFCAEPVSPAVQQFGMERICPRYINSYWATEHGGMVFSCPWGDFKDLQADARTWPLPWIEAEVRIATETDAAGRATAWRRAEQGEKGELVLTRPYPISPARSGATPSASARTRGAAISSASPRSISTAGPMAWPTPRATMRGSSPTAASPCTAAPTT